MSERGFGDKQGEFAHNICHLFGELQISQDYFELHFAASAGTELKF
jgi:hypothetical protein